MGWAAASVPNTLIRPSIGLQQRDQHADRGRLARPVGAEQAEGLAGLDGQVHVVHRDVVAEPVGDAGADHRGLGQGDDAAALPAAWPVTAAGQFPRTGRGRRSGWCRPAGVQAHRCSILSASRTRAGIAPASACRSAAGSVASDLAGQLGPQVAPLRQPPPGLVGDGEPDGAAVRQRPFAAQEALLGQAADQGADRVRGEPQVVRGVRDADAGPAGDQPEQLALRGGQRLGGPGVPGGAAAGPPHRADRGQQFRRLCPRRAGRATADSPAATPISFTELTIFPRWAPGYWVA